MLRSYLSTASKLLPTNDLTTKGIWINLIAPTEEEINLIVKTTNLSADLLKAALDEEERSHIEVDEGQLLILINIPIYAGENGNFIYDTIPLGIVVSENTLVTVCLRENLILEEFEMRSPKTFYTFKKTRFVLQILFITATYYLRYLRQIDKITNEIEAKLHKSMKNEELIKLLNLEKGLVYFTTSLRANEIVMEKLLRSQLKSPIARIDPDTAITSLILKMYSDDEDLLEDVITENKQAIEMCETYSHILSGMMDAFASIISNNLNMVMKFLASITIILSLPGIVASFYGMNVLLPFQNTPHAFSIAILISIILSLVGVIILKRKNMF